MNIGSIVDEIIKKDNFTSNSVVKQPLPREYFKKQEEKKDSYSKKSPYKSVTKYESPDVFLKYIKGIINNPISDRKYTGDPNKLIIDNKSVFNNVAYQLKVNYGIDDKKPYSIKGPIILN